MRKFLTALALVSVLGAINGYAVEAAQPFVTAKDIDLTRYLPAPPANDSKQTKEEIAEILNIQGNRTPEQASAAVADAEENVWRFADVMGSDFTATKLPKISAFFDRIAATEGAVTDPAKDFWQRPRPHMLSDKIKPIVKKSKSGSWPSGHATLGYLMATLLSDMVPEKRNELYSRASQYAENRIIAGIHYRSDTIMSRTAAALIVQKMFEQPDFKAEFDMAQKELRSNLGYKLQ
jgi:acid phosphatase (class A)